MTTKQSDGFEVFIERITVTKAKQILEKNTANRSIKPMPLARLKRALEANEFYLSPDAIHIGHDGTLYNGQHRLTAVKETGKSAMFIVLKGGGKEIQDITDDGVKRQAGDVLHIAGIKNSSLAASATRLVIAYIEKSDPRRYNTSNRKVLKAYESYDGIDVSISLAAKYNSYDVVPTSHIGAFHYLFSTASIDDANEFFERVSTGIDLGRDDPILALRNRVIRERSGRGTKTFGGVVPLVMSSWIVRAWNAWRAGESLDRLITPSNIRWIPDIDGCMIERSTPRELI